MQEFKNISFSKGFEATVVELFVSLLGSNAIETEKKITRNGKFYIADIVVNNRYIVEVKYSRNKKIPIHYIDDLAKRMSSFLGEAYSNIIIVIASDIDEKSRKELQEKYSNIELIDKTQLLKISEPFEDLHRRIISYFNAIEE